MQKWKTDVSLHSCKTVTKKDGQVVKKLDYETTYKDEFLESDPLRDWESIEGCKDLFKFCFNKTLGLSTKQLSELDYSFLDCGTKDCQMPVWVNGSYGWKSKGVEISDSYVKYAKEKGRPIKKGDVCNLPEKYTGKWDVVFSHHLLGLVSDYYKGLTEMFRCVRPGGYLITMNHVPGNHKKHYSYISDISVYDRWLKRVGLNPHEKIFYGQSPLQKDNGVSREIIVFLKKLEK